MTLSDQGYDTCGICRWFDDGLDDGSADEMSCTANDGLTLSQGRELFRSRLTIVNEHSSEYLDEQELLPAKYDIVSRFDRLVSGVAPRLFFDSFSAIQQDLKVLSSRRTKLIRARIAKLKN